MESQSSQSYSTHFDDSQQSQVRDTSALTAASDIDNKIILHKVSLLVEQRPYIWPIHKATPN